MREESSPVVIAGAGPNGLMLACELALAGVRATVLDSLPAPSDEPKANGLVGQVVRMLDMRGLYRAFTGDENPPQPTYGWMFSGMPLNFLGLQDNPMYAMLLSQPRLVRLLEKRARDLGVDVRWGHGLTDLRADADSVAVTVSSPSEEYRLTTAYAVGADGGRSSVRKRAGIDFPGSTTETVARLAHVRLPDAMLRPDGGFEIPGYGRLPFGHNRFDKGMVIAARFEPDRALVGTMERGLTTEDGPMSIAELQASLRRVLGVDVPLEEPRGSGPHALRRINGQNTRQADRYRDGHVLLLGDAAHVHSAMGGPGLNLGLADAVNLGWKLAAEVNGWAPAGLLDTYESERYPVGQRVMMHSLAQLALMAPGPEVAALRELFGELTAISGVPAYLAALLAGADVRYEVGCGHPLAGRLAPDLDFDDGGRLADLLHNARTVLLDLTGDIDLTHDRVDVVRAAMTDRPAAALLIRPDGYIAWAADTFGREQRAELAASVARWCG